MDVFQMHRHVVALRERADAQITAREESTRKAEAEKAEMEEAEKKLSKKDFAFFKAKKTGNIEDWDAYSAAKSEEAGYYSQVEKDSVVLVEEEKARQAAKAKEDQAYAEKMWPTTGPQQGYIGGFKQEPAEKIVEGTKGV